MVLRSMVIHDVEFKIPTRMDPDRIRLKQPTEKTNHVILSTGYLVSGDRLPGLFSHKLQVIERLRNK